MADAKAVSVRGIDPEIYRWLKVRAAQHDRSMEAEIRAIFAEVKLADETPGDGSLGALLESFVENHGGVDLDLPPRDEPARAADFSW
ncbi:FitA-like ribbon-helix-helix domain-containing protein [Glycomyces salinus]|uniref:FitA-like ribbon-helix-helix domain-containing protein n=1 Tax=Glycomyces salinus TaxID=980294 RepID=UPI001E2946BB|nr:hypothetical protein [Glycomyces salinus]